MRKVLLGALAMMSVHCASTQSPKTPNPMTSASTEIPEPGDRYEAWMLPHQVRRLPSLERCDEACLRAHLLAAKVIFIGENHPSWADHGAQIQIIKQLANADPSFGIGLEMVRREDQATLDRFNAGEISVTDLESALNWKQDWGFPWVLYRGIFEIAEVHQLPLYALNSPRKLTQNIARHGVDGLSPEDKAMLPKLDLEQEAHRQRIKAIFDAHMGGHGKMAFENFYAAQVTWDEFMAESVARALKAEGAPKRMVVIAGNGHVILPKAMPTRVAERGVGPGLSIHPCQIDHREVCSIAEAEANAGDLVWLMAEDSALLPD